MKRAAAGHSPDSQCNLGVVYMNGEGVRKNYRLAVHWYRQAGEAGDSWACYLLGLCYRDGEGVPKRLRWARHWWRKAAAGGVTEARKALD